MGNFDGVHLGHQLILQQVKASSQEMGAPSLLICFEPQPKEFFDAYNAPARLTRFREKVGLLAEYGVDLVLCLKFDELTRSMSPQAFISLLVNDLRLKALFAGDDARFGNDRSGDFDLLLAAGKQSGFEVTNLYTLTVGAERVSSTRIRECLANGDFNMAQQLLGRPYSITGKVVYGRQLGRTLDAPTANIQLHRDRAPIDGVYAVEIEGLDITLTGVANVGVRPTLNEATLKPILEVHIFDFAGTIYGKTVKVIFRAKIREEKKFTGLEALKSAIREDMLVARQFFKDEAHGLKAPETGEAGKAGEADKDAWL
jgi:riboflavin kinase/FMN adenylyltransferase